MLMHQIHGASAFLPYCPSVDIKKELIKRCLKGERKAQFELYKACYGPMMRVCLRYQNDDQEAMHVLNQAFLNVCTKLSQYRDEVVFESWVKRITINACIDEYRKNKKRNDQTQSLTEQDYNTISIAPSFNIADQELNAEFLRNLIRSLPKTSQQVFNLVVLDGYSYEEVSDLLDVNETTCRWHVHHARKTLQEMLQSEDKSLKAYYHEK